MTSTTGPSADRQCGWTLLELVLVLVILGTVLAMAAPSLGGFFASRRTADAAARIVALARLARERSRAEGRVWRLHLDPAVGSYRLSAEGPAGDAPLGTEWGRGFLLPEGTRLAWTDGDGPPAAGAIRFFPDGRKDAVSLRLAGRHGESVEVACPSALEDYRVVP